MNIIIFLIILLVLVVSHEWGHFIVAKKSGIRVDEFAFGMGPKIWSMKRGETTYRFNIFPIGGYVKIFGENPDEDSINGPYKSRSFINKSAKIQALVLVAGIAMNLIVAWLLFSVGSMTVGLPIANGEQPSGYTLSNIQKIVLQVSPKSPAFDAGLKSGDTIISIKTSSQNLSAIDTESLRNFIASNPGEEIEFVYRHPNDRTVTTSSVMPQIQTGDTTAKVGMAIGEVGTLKLPVRRALIEGSKITWYKTQEVFMGFYTLISQSLQAKANVSELSGPVGLTGMVGDAYSLGFSYLISFTAAISISLAVLNLMPFPALDGGRLLFLLIEKIKGSRIKPEIANMVNLIGFGLLMLLMLVITYHDIMKLF